MSNSGLIDRIKKGDQQAFKLLFDKYHVKVFNTCMGFLHNKNDAEDITQDVFIEVYKSINKFRGDSKFSTWIYRIAFNKSLNHIRDNKRSNWFKSIETIFTGTKSNEVKIKHTSGDDPEMIDELKEEGIKIVDSKIKITVGPTLDYENVMKDILLDKAKNLSDNPEEEALIILAHGDKNFMPVWKELSNETGNYILAKTGIEYFDNAFVEVGQSFAIDGVNPILKASENKKKVIVVGMYLSMGVKNMAENSGFIMMERTIESKKMFEGKNIVFAEHGLLPDKRIAEWIVDRAVEWLDK